MTMIATHSKEHNFQPFVEACTFELTRGRIETKPLMVRASRAVEERPGVHTLHEELDVAIFDVVTSITPLAAEKVGPLVN